MTVIQRRIRILAHYNLHALDADVIWWRIKRTEWNPVLRRTELIEGERVHRLPIETYEVWA
ncbi:hypothetical protein L226DRAFT_534675 [Lentinus tigrinus ALCF2SS1-7]|uniref:Uncharacterized protein n=1 Tax=Lentinus tigrinus ALCF2SS1-6 TaxID=1328759 RepID=A0A5C2SCM7_9APHY|nr:hypothetical protein L227DRAFT_574648 [Lentinus tigrinus ALCF2SS1-6]RPD75102.1 hypothetical protein L226DRAFT_534675 [Lentinus tigrinus ALCF2SS1-7]